MNLDIQGIHNWRQSQTMWNVLNYARHDANIFNPRTSNFNNGSNIKRYEFPIMQWSIGMAYRMFGEKIIIARLIMFSLSIAAILGMFFLIFHFTNNKASALIGAILFQYSPLFYIYSINPIPDIMALAMSIWYCVFILRYIKNKKHIDLHLAGFFMLLTTLSKLPYIMFTIISIVYFMKNMFTDKKLMRYNLNVAIIQLLWILPALAWYAWVMPTWGSNSVIKGIFSSETPWSEYQAIFNYHKKVMFPKIILNKYTWPLLLMGLLATPTVQKHKKYLVAILMISFIYLLFEFVPIGAVHDYYMLPFLVSFYTFVGIGSAFIIRSSKYLIFPLLILCIFTSTHTKAVNTEKWDIKYSGSNPALFTHTEELRKAVPQGAKCIILNDRSTHIFSYRIDKMGYIFAHDQLSAKWVKDMILNHDVQYMYSDSEKINTDPKIIEYIERTILSIGSIKVFKLISPSAI